VLPEQIKKANQKGPRSSVSAEAFGHWNKKSDFKPRVVHKSEEVQKKIRARLNQSFMFSALSEEELRIVVDAMEEKRFSAGQTIIE
jgi:cAMP-dependent protein kinase regulator